MVIAVFRRANPQNQQKKDEWEKDADGIIPDSFGH
jgi:hypothetical protein